MYYLPIRLYRLFYVFIQTSKQLLKRNNYALVLEHVKYLGKTLRNKNFFHEELKTMLKYTIWCTTLSSSLLSKNMKIKKYITIILPFVLRGLEAWSVTLREEQRLRVLENMIVRKIFWLKRDEMTEEWRRQIRRSFMKYRPTLQQTFFG